MTTNPKDATEPVSGIQTHLEEQLTYPAELAEVRERLGATVLRAPDPDESVTLQEVLDRSHPGHTFDSAEELFLTILNGLPEQYVGRKFQSERGVVIDEHYEPDRFERSF